MKNLEIDKLEAGIRTLAKDNEKLKKSVRWMSVVIVLFFIIQVYDLLVKIFLK